MSNQGWIVEAAPLLYSGFSGSPDFDSDKRISLPCGDNDEMASDNGESRLELLNRIKNRIKSGFYNSEAVIDDIGHGFAQALDQAL